MEHEDDVATEELQEILNEEHQETQRDVSPEKEEDEKGPMPTSAIPSKGHLGSNLTPVFVFCFFDNRFGASYNHTNPRHFVTTVPSRSA
jgi:hypothetical protein